jgi:hypothetical protein
MLKVTLAVPLLIVKSPVKLAPPISAVDTPVIIYGIIIPSATRVVVKVKVTEPPSFIDDTELVNSYVGRIGASVVVLVA